MPSMRTPRHRTSAAAPQPGLRACARDARPNGRWCAGLLTPGLLLGTLGALLPAALAQPRPDRLDLRVTEADFAPQVRVRDHDNRTVEEYRVNGNLYMLKVTPAAGAPYYLIDEDGSGELAWNRGQPGGNLQVPQWTLLSW